MPSLVHRRQFLRESTSERNWRVARERGEYTAPDTGNANIPATSSAADQRVDDSKHAIYMLDQQGRIRSWSDAAEQAGGQLPGVGLGRYFSCLYAGDDQRGLRPEQALSIAEQSGRYAEQGWRLRQDGSRFWADMAIDRVNDAQGEPAGYVLVIRDASQGRATELRLRDLHVANRELEQFIHIASHDLREPLRKLQSFVSLLRSEEGQALSDNGNAYLDSITNAAQRMQELLNSLLVLTRVTSQGQKFKPVELDALLADVCNDLAILIEEAGARVEYQDLGHLEADAAQLRQLFQNLISNSIKYAQPGVSPSIQISRSDAPDADQANLVVQDNGIGFEPRYRDRIFGVFQRLQGRDAHSGTGVGLSVCRKICERHGGEISAQSQVGAGARFTVTLPIKHNQPRAQD